LKDSNLMQPYVSKGVDPLIFRSSNDPERVKHKLGDIGHFTAIVNAQTTKVGCARAKDARWKMPYFFLKHLLEFALQIPINKGTVRLGIIVVEAICRVKFWDDHWGSKPCPLIPSMMSWPLSHTCRKISVYCAIFQ